MFAREEGLAKVQKSEFVNIGFQENDMELVPMYMHHENIFDPATLAHNFLNRKDVFKLCILIKKTLTNLFMALLFFISPNF